MYVGFSALTNKRLPRITRPHNNILSHNLLKSIYHGTENEDRNRVSLDLPESEIFVKFDLQSKVLQDYQRRGLGSF